VDKKRHLSFVAPIQSLPLYLDSIGYNPEQENIVRPRGFGQWHWLQTEGGEGRVELEGTNFTLLRGQGLLLEPAFPHRYFAGGQGWQTSYITFAGTQADAILTGLGMRYTASYEWDPSSDFQDYVKKSLLTVQDRDLSGLLNSALVYGFLTQLKRHGRLENESSIHSASERIAPLIQYMEEHYMEPGLDARELAAVLNLSSRRMSTIFLSASGATPHHYLRALRIHKAKEILLANSQVSIKEIARRVGYKDPSHFVYSFRQLEGTSPERFRQTDGRKTTD